MTVSAQTARDHVADYLHSTGPFRDRLSSEERRHLYGMADGFGTLPPGQLAAINGGWDWSHIRDASDEAILAMSAWLDTNGHSEIATVSPLEPIALPQTFTRSMALMTLHQHAPAIAHIVKLDDAQALIARQYGPFWITTTLDGSEASATLGPDYNAPEGGSLEAIWPSTLNHAGFRAELQCEDGIAEERDLACLVLIAGLKAAAARVPAIAPPMLRDLKSLHQPLLQDEDPRALSLEIHAALGQPEPARDSYLRDLSAVIDLVRAVRPQGLITTGLCYLSGHATLSGPDGKAWHEDIEPGEGNAEVGHQCIAILRCLIQSVGGFEDEEQP